MIAPFPETSPVRRKGWLTALIVSSVTAMVLGSVSSHPKGNDRDGYVGAERCKICHRPQYLSWAETAHRRATRRLAPEERTRECLRCHATGPEALPGVQCEACHGPGANYWPAEIMRDPQKARAAGLVPQKKTVCLQCHASDLPNHESTFSMPPMDQWPATIH